MISVSGPKASPSSSSQVGHEFTELYCTTFGSIVSISMEVLPRRPVAGLGTVHWVHFIENASFRTSPRLSTTNISLLVELRNPWFGHWNSDSCLNCTIFKMVPVWWVRQLFVEGSFRRVLGRAPFFSIHHHSWWPRSRPISVTGFS